MNNKSSGVEIQSDKINLDSFYSSNNINYLKMIIKDINEGRARFSEHKLIED